MGVTLDSWGGNPTVGTTIISGHVWNAAADWEYRNVELHRPGDRCFHAFAANDADGGRRDAARRADARWIAKDGDNAHCSFPNDAGGCDGRTADCLNPGPIADPALTSIESTPEMVAEWVARPRRRRRRRRVHRDGQRARAVGVTHYDVHPECPTYEEILDKYVCVRRGDPRRGAGRRSSSARSCAAGSTTGTRRPDRRTVGRRTSCPGSSTRFAPPTRRSGNARSTSSTCTSTRRATCTTMTRPGRRPPVGCAASASLWDPDYTDESWIDAPIAFIPRIKRSSTSTIPGTPLAITEWNFGADETMNGAIAIADVLGVYGREGVYAASYWRSPDVGSPGYFAFTMHGNYDGAGSAFEGAVVPVSTSDVDTMDVFAAIDADDGVLRLMFVNKRPDQAVTVDLVVDRIHGVW